MDPLFVNLVRAIFYELQGPILSGIPNQNSAFVENYVDAKNSEGRYFYIKVDPSDDLDDVIYYKKFEDLVNAGHVSFFAKAATHYLNSRNRDDHAVKNDPNIVL